MFTEITIEDNLAMGREAQVCEIAFTYVEKVEADWNCFKEAFKQM